jgi:hypothetical protein
MSDTTLQQWDEIINPKGHANVKDVEFLVNHSIVHHHGEPWKNVEAGIAQTTFNEATKEAALKCLWVLFKV